MDAPGDDGIEPLGELDLAIVHALQIDARAPWTRVAAAVGADSSTVVRHWQRLREGSRAWLTAWPVAFPTALLMAPVARRIVRRLVAAH